MVKARYAKQKYVTYRPTMPMYRRIPSAKPAKGLATLGRSNPRILKGEPPYEATVSKEEWKLLNGVLDYSGLTEMQASFYRFLVWWQMNYDYQPSKDEIKRYFGRDYIRSYDGLMRTGKIIALGHTGWVFPHLRWVPIKVTGAKSLPQSAKEKLAKAARQT